MLMGKAEDVGRGPDYSPKTCLRELQPARIYHDFPIGVFEGAGQLHFE